MIGRHPSDAISRFCYRQIDAGGTVHIRVGSAAVRSIDGNEMKQFITELYSLG
jgi:hypothetical protein